MAGAIVVVCMNTSYRTYDIFCIIASQYYINSRHAVTDKGLLEVLNLTGGAVIPPFIGKPSSGRAAGAIDAKLSAVRIGNHSTSLQSLDLLLSQSSRKLSMAASAIGVTSSLLSSASDRSEIGFNHLRESTVFTTMMSKPQRCSVVAQDSFPVVSSRVVADTIEKFAGAFSLNIDQREVLVRVGLWFAGGEERNSANNVILVHGVFGCGKSFLVAVICLFIKELSAASAREGLAKKQQLGNSNHGSNNMPSVKVLMSSNTNVAVDRVMTLLSAFDKEQSDREDSNSSSSSSAVDTSIKIARVGCAQKIDKMLRKYIVLMTENRLQAQRELSRLITSSTTSSNPNPNANDPLLKLLEETKKETFNDKQKGLLKDAHVVGVTCASAANARLLPLRFPVLILDEASQVNFLIKSNPRRL